MKVYRKKCKLISCIYKDSKELTIIINEKPLEYYNSRTLENPALNLILSNLKGFFNITTKGGGFGSLKYIIARKLYTFLPVKLKESLKSKYSELTRTDTRMIQPKKAGGKARAKTQKSYR